MLQGRANPYSIITTKKKGDFKRLALEGYKKISDNTQHSIKHIYGFS
jgi:hypothetical protein